MTKLQNYKIKEHKDNMIKGYIVNDKMPSLNDEIMVMKCLKGCVKKNLPRNRILAL